MKKERTITFYGDYFQRFYLPLSGNVKEKIRYVFSVIEIVEKIPEKFLKHIEDTDGLYEIRIEASSNIYRIFCCFDQGNLVVLFNGFHKKTQKTPKQEISLAEKLKGEYFAKKRGAL
ncbi:MAG: type II toxin-antitoxin system RelE/ParE family toxin [Pyrinomonadaceae bacterium]